MPGFVQPSSPSRANRIAAAEQRGAQVLATAFALGDLPDLTIDDDEWEDVSDSDDSDNEDGEPMVMPSTGSTVSPPPSMPPSPIAGEAASDLDEDQPSSASARLEQLPTTNADPFRRAYIPRSIPVPDEVHPHPVVYLVYVTILWLHTQCKLPFRACNAHLVIFSVILSTLAIPMDPPLCTTLLTVMSQLRADADFQELPICTKCLQPFPATTPTSTLCSVCSTPLFNTKPTVVQETQGRSTRAQPKPYLRCPYKSLEEQLVELVPEIEHLVDAWRTKPRTPGKFTDIFDGDVCREVKGPDGLPFFRPDLKEMPNGELRIGVTMGVDWFLYRRSLISASHSSCPMSYSIVNLPPNLKYVHRSLLTS